MYYISPLTIYTHKTIYDTRTLRSSNLLICIALIETAEAEAYNSLMPFKITCGLILQIFHKEEQMFNCEFVCKKYNILRDDVITKIAMRTKTTSLFTITSQNKFL